MDAVVFLQVTKAPLRCKAGQKKKPGHGIKLTENKGGYCECPKLPTPGIITQALLSLSDLCLLEAGFYVLEEIQSNR